MESPLTVELEQHQSADPLLVVILGPTASGKTSLSLAIARKFNGEIVNCDSVAMYREFDIGTAKPSLAERSQAPHHLFDCLNPDQETTAGEYARQARVILSEVASRRHLPIVVGGTGLYLRALIEGLFPVRNDRKTFASALGSAPRAVDRIISRKSCRASIRVQPRRSIQTTRQS